MEVWGGEVGGGRGGVERWEGFGSVSDVAVRFGTGAGGSIRYSVKVLLKRP